MLKRRIDFILYAVIACLSLVTFYSLFDSFYQQDEWMAHGHFLVEGPFAFLQTYSFLGLLGGGGRIPAQLFQYLLFTKFPFNMGLLATVTIIFHIANAILVYHIAYSLFKSRLASILAAVFFVTASSANQTVTWFGASTNALPSASFALLSVLYYLRFLTHEKRGDLVVSFLLLFLSYFMKQSSIFLFVLYPVFYIFTKGISFSSVKKSIVVHSALFIFLCVIILPTFVEIFFREQTSANIAASSNPIRDLITHIITYPINSFSQMYFFPAAMFRIAHMFGPSLTLLEVQTSGANTASFIISTILLGGFAWLYSKNKAYRRELIFALLFTLMSFLPFVGLQKVHAYLDSRYYYFGVVGGGLLISYLVLVLQKTKKLSEYTKQVGLSGIVMVFAVYTIFQIYFIHQELDKQALLARQRIIYLNSITKMYPQLPANTIIFANGTAANIIPGNFTPFQQGPGFTFMVWYYNRGNIPAELIKTNYLWEIDGQGYRETAEGGFGYYYDFAQLKKDYDAGFLKRATIIGIYYDSQAGRVYDITEKLHEELKKSHEAS